MLVDEVLSRARPHGSSKEVVMLLAKPYIGDTRVKNEAESLTEAGYDVTVLSWDRSGIQRKNFTAGDVKVVSVRLLGGSEFSKLSYALSAVLLQFYSFVWCLNNLGRRYTVHCNDFNTLLAGAMLKLSASGNVRLVYDCHELTPSVYAEWYGVLTGLVAGAVEKGLLRFVDIVFTVSPPIRNYLSHVTSAPIYVIYNTIRLSDVPIRDKEWWRNRLDLSGFIVSYVGSLREDVGLDEFVEAARHFKEASIQGITFLVVGAGPDLNRIRAAAKGLGDYVVFVPRVAHAEALGYVTASDVSFAVYKSNADATKDHEHKSLISGNSNIALPWKVFEAMACGTCVLIRENTYTWIFVNTIGYGLSAGLGSTPEIVEALEWALENQETVNSMSRSARSHFLDSFHWEKLSQRLVSTYDSLTDARGAH